MDVHFVYPAVISSKS